MQSHFLKYFPSLSQLHPPAVYVPSFDEICRLIEIANSHERTRPVGDLAYIVASTGLRTGELENLRVTDVDSYLGLVQIESKRQGMIRYVLVSSRALQTLVSLHARFPESELVFGDRSRSYLQTLLKKFHLLACKIGAENMRLHSLRRAMVRHLHHLANSEQEETAIQYLADHALHTAKSELDLQTILEIAKPFLEDLWAELDVKKV